MNIFYVDQNPVLAAQMLCDKHVNKMLIESAQILSTVSHGVTGKGPYKPTHKHHPCVKWCATSREHYHWLMLHALALAAEFEYRYDKTHASKKALFEMVNRGTSIIFNLPNMDWNDPPQCMPDTYKCADVVAAYRSYYINEKSGFATWNRGRLAPYWYATYELKE